MASEPQVRCAGGLFQADNPAATGVVSITPRGALRDPLPESLWERYRESYRNELDFMADVAQGETPRLMFRTVSCWTPCSLLRMMRPLVR